MNRNVRIGLIVVAVIVVIGAAGAAFVWFSGGSGDASEAVVAPTFRPNETEVADVPTPLATEDATETVDLEVALTEEPADEVAEVEPTATEDEAADTTAPESDPVTFAIVQDESQVSFTIFEELRGQPVDVVGTTNQVAALFLVDFDNPQQSQLGAIRINVRTLETDNEFRNRAIRGQILFSSQDQYEFTEFVPTSVEGLPESVTIGEPFSFTVTGDLTLVNTTRPVTFDVTVTPISRTRIEGEATATVRHADFGLSIPDVQIVANVGEDVLLQIQFVAEAQESDT